MTTGLHNLQKAPGSTKSVRRVGRGHGSGRGKTAGRGTKGQKSRTGGSKGLKRMGLRRMVMSIPKARGFSRVSRRVVAVSFWDLNRHFSDGATVDLAALLQAGVVSRGERAKVLSTGKLERRNLVVAGVAYSQSARVALEKMGGSVKD